jgi:hypothetical protein
MWDHAILDYIPTIVMSKKLFLFSLAIVMIPEEAYQCHTQARQTKWSNIKGSAPVFG